MLLNALLYPGIKTSAHKNSLVAIFHTSVIYLKAKYLDILNFQFSNFGILCCFDQVSNSIRLFLSSVYKDYLA